MKLSCFLWILVVYLQCQQPSAHNVKLPILKQNVALTHSETGGRVKRDLNENVGQHEKASTNNAKARVRRLADDEEEELLDALALDRERRGGDRYSPTSQRTYRTSRYYRYGYPNRQYRRRFIWYRRRYWNRQRTTSTTTTTMEPSYDYFPVPRNAQSLGTTSPYACQLEGDVLQTKECPPTFQCTDEINIKLGSRNANLKFCKQSEDSLQMLTCEVSCKQSGRVLYTSNCGDYGECGSAYLEATSDSGQDLRYSFCQHVPKPFLRDPYNNHFKQQSCYFSSGGFTLGRRQCARSEGECNMEMTYNMAHRTWGLKFCSPSTGDVDYLEVFGRRENQQSVDNGIQSDMPLPPLGRPTNLGTTDPQACKAEGDGVSQQKECIRGYRCSGKIMTVTHNNKEIVITFCSQYYDAIQEQTCEAHNKNTNQFYRKACSAGVCGGTDGKATLDSVSMGGDPISYKFCHHLPKQLDTDSLTNHISELVCYYSSGGFYLGGRPCKSGEGTCSAEITYDMTDRTWDVKVCTTTPDNVDYIHAFGPRPGDKMPIAETPSLILSTVPLPANHENVGTSDPVACKAEGTGVYQSSYCPQGYACNGKTMTITHNSNIIIITFCAQSSNAFGISTCEAVNTNSGATFSKSCYMGSCGVATLTAHDASGNEIEYKFCHHMPKPLDTDSLKNHIYHLSCYYSSGGFRLGSRTCEPSEGTCSLQASYDMVQRTFDVTMCTTQAEDPDYLIAFGPKQ